MPDWFEVMTTPVKIAFLVGLLGGLAGFGSLVVNIFMAKANRGMERSTARSVLIAEEANALTRESVRDQIETNRRARSASVRIIGASYQRLSGSEGTILHDDGAGMVFRGGMTGFMTLTIMNEGAAPAVGVQVTAADFSTRGGRSLGLLLDDEASQFASMPFQSFRVLHPTESKEIKFAIRNSDADGNLKPRLEVSFDVSYSDSVDHHTRRFELTFLGTEMQRASPGMIFEPPWPIGEGPGERGDQRAISPEASP